MIEIIGATVLLIGAGIVLIGAIGLLRFPDFYCRLHSAGVIDTLGSGMTLLGLLLLAGSLVVAAKILMVGILIFFLSPVVAHALAKSARQSGIGIQQAVTKQGRNKQNRNKQTWSGNYRD
ncbi:monovalent cation/H(+) antiporter subunit G [Candidatus Spongiihabitans sp.]|uniref:monovalent cation/H(+) antiporter subunit G n=1 Tax=Candidatus Spongiihabitans sp. TaxID=3101308 RepID=UPI003C6F006C